MDRPPTWRGSDTTAPENRQKKKGFGLIFGYLFSAALIGAFFCPEIRAFTGFWGEISSTLSKVLSDRKVQFKREMAVNSR